MKRFVISPTCQLLSYPQHSHMMAYWHMIYRQFRRNINSSNRLHLKICRPAMNHSSPIDKGCLLMERRLSRFVPDRSNKCWRQTQYIFSIKIVVAIQLLTR